MQVSLYDRISELNWKKSAKIWDLAKFQEPKIPLWVSVNLLYLGLDMDLNGFVRDL